MRKSESDQPAPTSDAATAHEDTEASPDGDPVKTPLTVDEHLKAVAAGFNYTDEVKRSEGLAPAVEVAIAREERLQAVEAAEASVPGTLGQSVSDVIGGMPTVTIWNYITAPGFKSDPNFTDERFEARIKEAIDNGLPLEWAPKLEGATSDEHFDYLLGRSLKHIERQQRLSEAGWGVWGANFLAQLLDPASAAIAFGVIGPAYKLAQATKMGLTAQRGLQAAAGGLAGAAVVGAEDAAGQQPHTSEYLMAIGLGALLGGAFGPMATNPATAREAAALTRMGQEMHFRGERLITPRGEIAEGLEGATRHEFRPAGPAAIDRAVEAAQAPKPSIREVDPERVLEVQIEANRLAVEAAKETLKTLKRGSPEAEEVRLAAVAANKEMLSLQQQLKTLQETGEVPQSLRQPTPAPDADDVTALPDEIADLAPDPAFVERELANLRAALTSAVDDDAAEQIEQAILDLQAQANAAARDFVLVPDDPPPQSAGAAANPDAPDVIPETAQFLHVKDDDWRVLKPGQVARPQWAHRRIDRSGRGGRSENEASALVFHHLFNDTVGKKGHAKTPWTVDQNKDQHFAKFRVPYYQARMAGFAAYARAMGYNRISRVTRYDEFDQHVGLALRSGGDHLPENLPQEAQQAILRTAEGLRKAYADILEKMQEANLPGARDTKPDPNFMPRRFNKRALQEVARDPERGVTAIEDVVRIAIKTRHDELGIEIREPLLQRLSKGYAKNIINRAYDVGDEWTIAITNGDRKRFAALLRDDANMTDAEIDEVMSHLWSLREKSKSMFGSLNQRVLLDEIAEDPRTGLRFYQLLDNNSNRVFTSYANQAAGHIALAELKLRAPIVPRMKTVEVRNPDGTSSFQQVQDGFSGGHVIFDGIRTAADEQKLYSLIRQWGADHLSLTGEDISTRTAADLRLIKFAFDRIKGIPDERQMTAYGHFLRDLRNYNFIRLMWQGGVAQVLEAGSLVGTLGVKAAFSQMPGFQRMIDAAGNSRLRSALLDELESIGIGGLRLHGMAFHHVEQVGDDLAFAPTSGRLRDRASNALSYATQVTNEYSAMGWVTQQLERWAGGAIVQRMADIGAKLAKGKKLSRSDKKRLAQLDIDEADMEAIARQLRTHATMEDRVLFKGKVARLNFDKWDDLAAKAKFEHAIFRYTRKLVQMGDLGNTALWMSEPTWQTFFQFRNFTFTAWQNHTLYNLHMADMPALMAMVVGFGWAAAVRGAQVKAIASLRPDGKEYEDRHLTPEALAKAAFQRTGPASLLPAIIDTVALFTGQQASFDARHTGQPTDIVGGSPSVSLAFSVKEGLGGAVDSLIRQRPISQAEVRAIMSALPMATFIPFMSATSHMIKDLPKRAPQKQPLFGD